VTDPAPRATSTATLPRWLETLTRVMNAAGSVWIIALMVLIVADVAGRDLLGRPVRGVTEMLSLSIVGIVFLQLGDTLRAGRFTRADVLLDRLRRDRPRLAHLLLGFYELAGALFLAIILWASWEPLVESIRIGEYVGAIGDFTAPTWPIRLIIVSGAAVTATTFLLLAIAEFHAARRK
jgi:TRAP-type mannitol/chloroaromatic compound transport system permease small subunit